MVDEGIAKSSKSTFHENYRAYTVYLGEFIYKNLVFYRVCVQLICIALHFFSWVHDSWTRPQWCGVSACG